jgi:hypothetical protein
MSEIMGDQDQGLEEIRRVRHEISRELGHDPARLLEYYRDLQVVYANRLIRSEPNGGTPEHDEEEL